MCSYVYLCVLVYVRVVACLCCRGLFACSCFVKIAGVFARLCFCLFGCVCLRLFVCLFVCLMLLCVCLCV